MPVVVLAPLLATLLLAAPPDAGRITGEDAGATTPARAVGVLGEITTSPEARLEHAQATLEALKLEEAQAELEALAADPSASASVRARAWLALGMARASLVDDDGARVAFAAALAIDSTLALPEGSSPKVLRLFERTRARLPSSATPDASSPSSPSSSSSSASSTGPSAIASAAPAASGSSDVVLTVAGGVLLALGVGAGVGALVADDALAHPEAGRTRDAYDGIRNLGIAGVVGAVALGVAGAAAVALGVVGPP